MPGIFCCGVEDLALLHLTAAFLKCASDPGSVNRRETSKRTHVCDGFLCFLLCISGFLNAVLNFIL